MRKRICGFCLIILLASLIVTCSETDEPKISSAAEMHLNEILKQMESRSINRKTIDWVELKRRTLQVAGQAKTIKETYTAIRFALEELKDNHSFYKGVDGTYIFSGLEGCNFDSPPDAQPSPAIGYIRIPGFDGFNSVSETNAFAQSLQAKIRSQDNSELKGWLVDLRGNGGGNMWPMLSGIGPVLGDGIAGYFIDPDNQASAYSYQNGVASLDGNSISVVSNPYSLIKPNPKVAVLIDGLTASSGEAIAIAFIGRPNTRLFGVKSSCGLTTANQSFTLSNGGLLFLTVAVMADRSKNKFGGPILPDEMSNSGQEGAVTSAIVWLNK